MIRFLLLLLTLPAAAAPLDVPEAMRLAVERSPEAAAARARRDAAALEEPMLLSNLDPKALASYLYQDDRSPRQIPAFQGTRSRLERWETGFSQTTLLGTEARMVWRGERLVNPSAFRPVDPTVDSRLALELKQRLLRYFWGRPDVARRSRARAGTAAAEADFAYARSAAAAAAASAVVELGAALRVRAIREEAVADARLLLKRTEEKSRYGTAEASDRLQAEAALESAETELLLAQSGIERARHALASALREEGPAGSLEVSTEAASGLPSEASLPADEAAALAARPDVDAARRRRDALKWAERTARLDTLPDLTLDASYAFAGLDSTYRGAWSDMRGWRHPVAAVGFSVVVPLTFRQERLTRRQAALALSASEAELAAAENSARRAWRDSRESLALSRRRRLAAERLARIEAGKLKAGESDFRSGRATTDLLVRFQQDLRRAKAELVRAEADEALALIELARQAGTLGAS
ncbi:MAG: TolC family protein [Elusimicrobiota bacterium]|nr:MAG: TolC family protein [Elusimicrobiota bacterium]